MTTRNTLLYYLHRLIHNGAESTRTSLWEFKERCARIPLKGLLWRVQFHIDRVLRMAPSESLKKELRSWKMDLLEPRMDQFRI